ncbi:hypothetical protein [Priestia megaterium]|uniref:hypothetical protein n=1 Tax=Priestia megaterium TaxID=1404 RepID=UPI0013E2B880|nr:hypothetical protein [Priestia megaterium]MDI3091832.1 hypothetical protein [Priestia megaterium]MED3866109.1 hypothetical protein [Priestia megaterium]MED4101013.1 hypothetical protein [Priestia megaterium]MED4145434.1 hypothetical protein [Priestia megaterium]MED4170760.1 hypothetical protein [Priestia megaterium]
MDDYKLVEDFVSNIIDSDLKIIFDKSTLKVKIVDKEENELDLDSLEFIFGELGDYVSRKKEEYYGEERTQPLDDLAKKRLDLEDYTLIHDFVYGNSRDIFEIYYDKKGIFTMNSYTVDLENNLKYNNVGFKAFLNVVEVEKLLKPLQNYVCRYKKIKF